MNDLFLILWGDLGTRWQGPLAFRLFLQPLMAVLLAIRDGRRDAHAGQLPYFWALFTHADQRRALLRGTCSAIGKVFLLALALDALYQVLVYRWIYLGDALVIACVLAILPYVILRGPVNRLLRR